MPSITPDGEKRNKIPSEPPLPEVLEKLLGKLEDVREMGEGWKAVCPGGCESSKPSLSVLLGEERIVLFDHHVPGCSEEDILEALGMGLDELFEIGPDLEEEESNQNGNGRNGSANGHGRGAKPIVYSYRDKAGSILFQVHRVNGQNGTKQFKIYRPDPKRPGKLLSGFGRGETRVQPVLYNLPFFDQAIKGGHTVYLVEGEKACEVLKEHKRVATTSPNGAKGWRFEYAPSLAGADLVVIPDNDQPGWEYAGQAAADCALFAKRVRLLELPGLPPGGDVVDWLECGYTIADLEELARTAPVVQPAPRITVKKRPSETSEEVLNFYRRQEDPALLSDSDGRLVRVEEDPLGQAPPRLAPVSEDALFGELDRHFRWVRRDARGNEKEAGVPIRTVKDLRAMRPADRRLPVATRVSSAPFFTESGELVDRPGFHKGSGVLLHLPKKLRLPEVPKKPTAAEVKGAVSLLTDELLADFPFDSNASRAHALAGMLTVPAREMITGPVPAFLIDAPSRGSGKNLLGGAIYSVALASQRASDETGFVPPPTGNEEEWRKFIVSVLLPGPSIVYLLEVQSFSDPTLAQVLTSSGAVEVRTLGTLATTRVFNRALWLATGNNADLDIDAQRRTILSRLDPEHPEPWNRPSTSFRHDLRAWIPQNIGGLVQANLTLIQHWICQGRPEWKPSGNAPMMGSFEGWCRTVGGILEAAGVEGFRENARETQKRGLSESAEWSALFSIAWEELDGAGWREKNRPLEVTTNDLWKIVEDSYDEALAEDPLLASVLRSRHERGRQTQLGSKLTGIVARMFPDNDEPGVSWRIIDTQATNRRGAKKYTLERVEKERIEVRQEPGPTGDDDPDDNPPTPPKPPVEPGEPPIPAAPVVQEQAPAGSEQQSLDFHFEEDKTTGPGDSPVEQEEFHEIPPSISVGGIGPAALELVEDAAAFPRVAEWIETQEAVAIDFETIVETPEFLARSSPDYTGRKKPRNRSPHPSADIPRLLQIGGRDRVYVVDLIKSGVVTLGSRQEEAEGLTVEVATASSVDRDLFRPILAALEKIKALAHNASYDLGLLRRWFGCTPKRVFCTFLASQVLASGLHSKRRGVHSLLALCQRHLGVDLPKTEQLSNWRTLELSPAQIVYAARDVLVLPPLVDTLSKNLGEEDLTRIAGLEFAALPAFIDQELGSFVVDREGIKARVEQLTLDREESKTRACEAFGVSSLSSKSLAAPLAALGIELPKTAKGQIKLDSGSLEKYREIPGVADLIAYQSGKSLPDKADQILKNLEGLGFDGRLHPSIAQLGSDSGRVSAKNPNVFGIPKPHKSPVRRLLGAAEGCTLIVADYSAIELRLAAQHANEKTLIEVFQRGGDPHRFTAAKMLGKPEDEITKEERQNAKAVNFGLLYGMGAEGLKQYALDTYGLEWSLEEAKAYRAAFFDAYPAIKSWHKRTGRQMNRLEADLKKNKNASVPIKTALGRRRIYDRPYYTSALNHPIQGAGADGLKLALWRLWPELQALGGRVMVTVHDEIVIEVPEDRTEEGRVLLETAMKDGMGKVLKVVPVEIELEVRKTWG